MSVAPPVLEKRLSAMMRIRNEEEFLYAAVSSILPCVEEAVLV